MRGFAFGFLLMALSNARPLKAAQVIVQDPCSSNRWLDVSHITVGHTVGAVTIAALNARSIPFVGDEAGISSIKGTMTGDKAVEVISNTEMRAYGWCFHLNGKEPGDMPDKVEVKSDADVILWFFGYAHYRAGTWIEMCAPTSAKLTPFACRSQVH